MEETHARCTPRVIGLTENFLLKIVNLCSLYSQNQDSEAVLNILGIFRARRKSDHVNFVLDISRVTSRDGILYSHRLHSRETIRRLVCFAWNLVRRNTWIYNRSNRIYTVV